MKSALSFFAVALLAATAGFFLYRYTNSPGLIASAEAATTPAAASKAPPMATTLPEFSLENRDGKKQSVRSWPGKAMIVNFWATWCAPCRKEIPLLKEISKNDAKDGFQVVGIAIDSRDEVLKYADSIKMDYPILIGEQDGLAFAEALGVSSAGLPFTVFTDTKGRIVTILMGELTRAKADAILDGVKQVNGGQLTPTAARTAIANKMAGLAAK